MITLATLPKATEQEVFDQVARHLLTQNAKSSGVRSNCLYLSDDGKKCAVGCLIAKDEYHAGMEGTRWSGLISNHGYPAVHENLISELQKIHDLHGLHEWKSKLTKLAKDRNLKLIPELQVIQNEK